MTDISGIRIIVFIESEITAVSNIIKESFSVDLQNSSNKDDILSSNEVGYRSVHFVCDLGEKRAELPEFSGLCDLKFEFQVRTVLQHAWAELAHDRSYKFHSALPKEIQRRLYLHAGLLEIADKGFSDIAKEIDAYTNEIMDDHRRGNLEQEINSITLRNFVEGWARENKFHLEKFYDETHIAILIDELRGFDITKISQLNNVIPKSYAKISNEINYSTNLYGLVRDFLIIKDIRKLKEDLRVRWSFYDPESEQKELDLYKRLSTPENYEAIINYIKDEEDGAEHNFSNEDF